MLEIIKSKGVGFVRRRMNDKIRNKISLHKQKQTDNTNCTYSNKYNNNQEINPVYNSKKIRYDLNDKEFVLKLADLICSHKFNLLGSGIQEVAYNIGCKGFEGYNYDILIDDSDINELLRKSVTQANFGYSSQLADKLPDNYKPIDWQRDFRSGYRWNPLTHFSSIQYGNIPGVDVKVPWELGRFGHLILLFYAWIFSEDRKYQDEFENQLIDFMAFNPPRFGVQWAMPMDVALRAVNISSVYSLFDTFGANFDDTFKIQIMNYLNDHLHHIMNNLEWSSGMRANHYFADICGIIYLSMVLPADEDTIFCFGFAANEFAAETLYQFQEDGSNFEGSLPYHNFTSEMMFQTYFMMTQAKKEKLVDFVENYSNFPAKKFRLHPDITARIELNKMNYYIEKGIFFLSEKFFERFERIVNFTNNIIPNYCKDFLIGDNDDGHFFRIKPYYYDDLSVQADNRVELKKIVNFYTHKDNIKDFNYFKDFGLYRLSSRNYEICVRCGSLGQNGKGGHAHNDQLSFELYSGNELLICDSGTYNYTAIPELRNQYRSTKSHNTLVIDGYEQNQILKGKSGNLFWMMDTSKATVNNYSKHHFSGVHYGYPAAHTRELNFTEHSVVGFDSCLFKGVKKVLFHLTNQAEIIKSDSTNVVIRCNKKLFSINSKSGKMLIEDYFYSPSYGVKYKSKLVVIESEGNEILWMINLEI